MRIENELRKVRSSPSYLLNNENLEQEFKDLTQLATQITGTSVCLINLFEADTLCTVAYHGVNLTGLDGILTACQITIIRKNVLQVKDLTTDPRFNLRKSQFKFYFGLPLTTHEGISIGSMCVLDEQARELSLPQQEMLLNLGRLVSSRVNDLSRIENLKRQNLLLQRKNQTLAHDMRAPVGGIMALANLAFQENEEDCKELISEYLMLIKESSKSVLDLAEEILNDHSKTSKVNDNKITLLELKEKIYALFAPGLRNKDIEFSFILSENTASIPFDKANLQQIIGNLLSNAIKFTPNQGLIIVDLELTAKEKDYQLTIKVTDTGRGIQENDIQALLKGDVISTEGINGELGYGLGLQFVKQLILEKKGKLEITAQLGKGSSFTAVIPVA